MWTMSVLPTGAPADAATSSDRCQESGGLGDDLGPQLGREFLVRRKGHKLDAAVQEGGVPWSFRPRFDALLALLGGRGRSCNGVPCPFGPVDGFLCPGCCHGRFFFRPLRLLHVSLHLVKAFPPPERRFPRPLLSPPRTLEFLHRGQGAVAGVPVVGRALSLAPCRARGDQPLALRRTWRKLALPSVRVRTG